MLKFLPSNHDNQHNDQNYVTREEFIEFKESIISQFQSVNSQLKLINSQFQSVNEQLNHQLLDEN